MSFASHKEVINVGGESIHGRYYDAKLFSISHYDQNEAAIPKSIEAAVPKRQAEFLAGRLAARDALEAIHFHSHDDIPIGKFREPIWPEEIIGAISHIDSIAISIVKYKEPGAIVGLDIENVMSENLCDEIEPMLTSSRENQLLELIPLRREVRLSVLFSAKESLFKAIFPEVRQYMNFLDSEVTYFSLKQQTVGLRMVKTLNGVSFRNQYIVHFRIFDNKVMTLLT